MLLLLAAAAAAAVGANPRWAAQIACASLTHIGALFPHTPKRERMEQSRKGSGKKGPTHEAPKDRCPQETGDSNRANGKLNCCERR